MDSEAIQTIKLGDKEMRSDAETEFSREGEDTWSLVETEISSALLAVDPPSLRASVREALVCFCRILDYLRVIESGPRDEGARRNQLLLFKLIRDKALLLLGYLENVCLQERAGENELLNTLDGLCFAMRHELRRVYESELGPTLSTPARAPSRTLLLRAHGLLQNCFRQSVITLAKALDTELTAERLFHDYKTRRLESLALYRELQSLARRVQAVEKEYDLLSGLSLVRALERFRSGNMRHLMYKDWDEMENFVEEAKAKYAMPAELKPVLRRFGPYLQALLRQVSMRDVLADYAGNPTQTNVNGPSW